MNRILLSADSTCDLGSSLKEAYQVHYYPFHIILGGREYQDNVDITPQEIFQIYREKKLLPRTAAINVQEYLNYFTPFVEQGYEVIHLNLGGALSSAYQNCLLASKELPGIYPVDSCNLSTGIGGRPEKAGSFQFYSGYSEIHERRRTLQQHYGSGSQSAEYQALYSGGQYLRSHVCREKIPGNPEQSTSQVCEGYAAVVHPPESQTAVHHTFRHRRILHPAGENSSSEGSIF